MKPTLNIHWKDWCWSWSSQYFGDLMGRADSLKKALIRGTIEGRRRRGWQKMRRFDGITGSMDMSLNKLLLVKDREAWGAAVHRVTKSWTWHSNWTTKKMNKCDYTCPLLGIWACSRISLWIWSLTDSTQGRNFICVWGLPFIIHLTLNQTTTEENACPYLTLHFYSELDSWCPRLASTKMNWLLDFLQISYPQSSSLEPYVTHSGIC